MNHPIAEGARTRAIVAASICSLLIGCTSSDEGVAAADSETGELVGEVFIVTRGGPSIKLGLVTVVAISETDMKAHIEARRAEAKKLANALIPQLEAARTAVEAAENAVNQAGKEADIAAERAKQEYLACLGTTATRGECRAATPTREQIRNEMLLWRKREVKARETDLAKLIAEGDVLTSSAFYSTNLPPGIATAKTNADGLFTLNLPRNGKIALAARASRQLLGEVEHYYWLVWVSLDGASSKRVLLSNDNLTTVESPESVIKLPR